MPVLLPALGWGCILLAADLAVVWPVRAYVRYQRLRQILRWQTRRWFVYQVLEYEVLAVTTACLGAFLLVSWPVMRGTLFVGMVLIPWINFFIRQARRRIEIHPSADHEPD